jgi:hypothetical protein
LAELESCAKLFVFSANDPVTSYKRFAQVYAKAPGLKQVMLTRGSHVTSVQAEIIRFEWVGWTVSAMAVK